MPRCGQLIIDLEARRVYVDDIERHLTVKEFDLLALLASVPGKAWSYEDILAAAWQGDMMSWQKPTVTEHMGRLRKKLALDPAQPPWLQTIVGFGYRYERRDVPRWEPDQRSEWRSNFEDNGE